MTKIDRAKSAADQWNREKPELNTGPMVALGRLGEATQRIRRDYLEPNFAVHGLTSGDFDVLATLRRSGPPYALTPTDLYRNAMISSGGMTARADRLEKAGLVERKPHPTDRRALTIGLTKKGLALIDRVLPDHIAAQEKATAGLSGAELETLSALLGKLIGGLDGD
ncbi:MarR family transcriptional regulator [Rhodospirillaceae bacterium KN72]|uniref:MarR family transcriptional regulator n=1 Tax=Pacificispira spongiicola TaxID=2729598 RepID=A0A7Y0HDH8_9PROT|nr:MarR family transcriptional regulator [Pacificispira spongiicola]NMM43836.1 MarR family transcriptional regulator [Pacificispira spongiicola]